MQAQDAKRKTRKDSAQIKVSNERLQIVFSFGGRRHHFSTGFSDTPANRKLAEMKARQIDLDILSNNFDSTLAKYKPQPVLTQLPQLPQSQ